MDDIKQFRHTLSVLPLLASQAGAMQTSSTNGATFIHQQNQQATAEKQQRVNPVDTFSFDLTSRYDSQSYKRTNFYNKKYS